MFLEEIKKYNDSDLLCFWVFVAYDVEDETGEPKIKRAKTRDIFCWFVFVVAVFYLASDQIDNLYPIFNLVFQSGWLVVY